MSGKATKTAIRRLLEKVETNINDPQACWNFTSSHGPFGYAHFTYRKRTWHAHRACYQVWFHRPLKPSEHIDHLCRNRQCINPNHLEVVSKLENESRGKAFFNRKSYCKRGHLFTPENSSLIQSRFGGSPARRCRMCSRRRRMESYFRNGH